MPKLGIDLNNKPDCVGIPVPTPKVYKTEAIVLRRTNLGEADRILTLYTLNEGKIRAIAMGVRRPTSKLGGHVELLTHCSLYYHQYTLYRDDKLSLLALTL